MKFVLGILSCFALGPALALVLEAIVYRHIFQRQWSTEELAEYDNNVPTRVRPWIIQYTVLAIILLCIASIAVVTNGP